MDDDDDDDDDDQCAVTECLVAVHVQAMLKAQFSCQKHGKTTLMCSQHITSELTDITERQISLLVIYTENRLSLIHI